MRKLNKVVLAVAMLFVGLAAQAQDSQPKKERNYKLTPYMFVGVQGGVTRTFTNPVLDRKWASMGAVSVGAYLTPWLGLRLQGNGWQWDEDRLVGSDTYKTTQYGGNADLLLNLTGLLLPHRNNLLNVVLLGGYGLHYAKFDTDVTSHRFPLSLQGDRLTRGERFGGQLDLNLAKHFALQLEGGYHLMHDHFHNFKEERWWPYLMGGISFKFGHKKIAQPAPAIQPVIQETADVQSAEVAPASPVVAEQKPEVKPAPEPQKPVEVVAKAPEKQTDNVFFRLGRFAVGQEQTAAVEQIAAWAKAHPTATIALTGYADRQTGNARVNKAISERRAVAVKVALVERGIDADRITTDAKGDTEQPFADNDKNRVVVAVSAEK